jgi:hypothetical protein
MNQGAAHFHVKLGMALPKARAGCLERKLFTNNVLPTFASPIPPLLNLLTTKHGRQPSVSACCLRLDEILP